MGKAGYQHYFTHKSLVLSCHFTSTRLQKLFNYYLFCYTFVSSIIILIKIINQLKLALTEYEVLILYDLCSRF